MVTESMMRKNHKRLQLHRNSTNDLNRLEHTKVALILTTYLLITSLLLFMKSQFLKLDIQQTYGKVSLYDMVCE